MGKPVPGWTYTYPHGFSRLRNIDESRSPGTTDLLGGTPAPGPVARRRLQAASRLWVIELAKDIPPPAADVTGFRLARKYKISDIRLWLYVRNHQRPPSSRQRSGRLA